MEMCVISSHLTGQTTQFYAASGANGLRIAIVDYAVHNSYLTAKKKLASPMGPA